MKREYKRVSPIVEAEHKPITHDGWSPKLQA